MGTVEEKKINGRSLVIINNFLENSFFNEFKKLMFSNHINWYLKDHMTTNDDYFFSHDFFQEFTIKSAYYQEFIIPILKELKFLTVDSVRANLMLKKEKIYQSNFHNDRFFDCKTAILYMNTCNGNTLFDEKEKFKLNCVENTVVIFESLIKHSAVSQSDTTKRIVINFNGF
jgi:hypothetical protein